LISALVHYLGGKDAGTGFYAQALQLGLLPKDPTRPAKDEFGVSQVASVHRYAWSS
jgi:hypothetical protein